MARIHDAPHHCNRSKQWALLDWGDWAFPHFCAFLTNWFAYSAHNFKVVLIIDRTTKNRWSWQEFIMHHDIAIEKNSEQNLHIWSNLRCFFGCWHFWTLPLKWLCFVSNVLAIHPWFITSYDIYEQIFNISMRRCFALNITISEQSALPQVLCLKHP